MFLTFSPLSLDTCRLSLMSHLLPRTIFSTSDDACWNKSEDKIGIKSPSKKNHDVGLVFLGLIEKCFLKLQCYKIKTLINGGEMKFKIPAKYNKNHILAIQGNLCHSKLKSRIEKGKGMNTSSMFLIQFLIFSKDFSLVMS